MAKKPKTLKEIAIELLEKYEASESAVIWEYSTNIKLSEEMLKKEVDKYRKMIDKKEMKTKTVKYFDEDEMVWKIGEVIVDE